jgi:hypothetical protein
MNIRPYLVPAIVTAALAIVVAWANNVIPGGVGTGPMLMPVLAGVTVFRVAKIKTANKGQPTASGEARAAALAFPSRPGQGAIVIWRRTRSWSSKMAAFNLSLDGAFAARLMPRQFVIVPVASGTHRLLVEVQGAPGAGVPCEVVIAQGQVLFFEIRTAMKVLISSLHLDPLDDTPDLRARLGKTAMVMPIGGPSA